MPFAANEQISPCKLEGELVRVVESQEQVATSKLVDNLYKQHLLEQMLEGNKPKLPAVAKGLHYLLAAPFRYPPLRNGSRFGSRYEPGVFYGSKTLTTALAETAYYRFVFWFGMRSPPETGKLKTQHTVFGAAYRTAIGLRLQHEPYAGRCGLQLTDPADYSTSQGLGRAMREAGIQAFEFVSARDQERGINVALFTPLALFSAKPLDQQEWLCETGPDSVSYTARTGEIFRFGLQQFQLDGVLPQPAN